MKVCTMQNRTETISALRPYVPTMYFRMMLDLSTPMLKALLTFYLEGGTEKELDRYFCFDKNIIRVKVTNTSHGRENRVSQR